jgi:glycosyl transferase, family 25
MTGDPGLAKRQDAAPPGDFTVPDCHPAHTAPLQPIIVSLDRRPDRWQKAVKALARVGISRVSKCMAVDGATLSDQALVALVDGACVVSDRPTSHTQLTRPAIGCFLSHLTIWKRFLDGDRDRLVVLEDDAVPSPSYSANYAERVLAAIPAGADLVLLGGTIMAGLAEKTGCEFLSRVYYFNGTYAYLVTRKGCAKLLQHLLPLRAHIDHQISQALISNPASLFAYAVTPALFEHDFSSWSDAYVPITEPDEADRQLGALLTSARDLLRRDGRIGCQED